MKDGLIKGTGNSRYLRSSIPASTTHQELVDLLRSGEFPIDLNGINEAGWDIIATALSKATLLSDATEALMFGAAADRTVNQMLAALMPWKLIDTIDNTRGYSGEWEAPDLFGDGSAYDLGVYEFGGGESGESDVFVEEWENSENDYALTAPGGASGYGKNAIIRNVSPGTLIPWVIGKGGIAQTSKTGADRVAGGTTSFGGITALGGGSITAGEGGQPSTGRTSGTNVDYYGCVVAKDDSHYGYYVIPQNPREGQNQFDPLMLTLACGFGASARVSYNSDTGEQKGYSYTETPGSDNPTQGELGLGASKCVVSSSTTSITVTATSGTNGNGGGGAVAMHGARDSGVTVSVTAGNGGDGMIFLYARKAVSE